MRKSIYNILKEASELKTEDEIVNALRVANPAVRQLIRYAYDPAIKFMLPEGSPPYKPCEFLDQEGRLPVELRKLYLFVEGGNPNLTKVKREMLFIQLIESIDKDDAVLLCSVKDKKLPFKKLTKKLIKKAFPDDYPDEEK